jgi:hypothetical protein
MKGSFTFEDKYLAGEGTGRAVGAGALEMSSDLVVGVIGMGEGIAVKAAMAPKAVAADKLAAGVLVVTGAGIDGMTEFAKATVDGKTVQSALKKAGARAGLHLVSAGAGPVFDKVFSSAAVEELSFPVTVTTRLAGNLAANIGVSSGSDALVTSIGGDAPKEKFAEWHQSLACTYTPLGDSDVVYVEQYAMRRASR